MLLSVNPFDLAFEGPLTSWTLVELPSASAREITESLYGTPERKEEAIAESEPTQLAGMGGPPVGAQPKATVDSSKGKSAWYKTWWFWTIVGAAAAGAGGAAYFLGQGTPTDTVQVNVTPQ